MRSVRVPGALLVVLSMLLTRTARADEAAWVISPAPEGKGAVAAGAPTLARGQELARLKRFADAVTVLETLAHEHPATLHDCTLALAYLRVEDLTRAQLWVDVALARGTTPPDWCTGSLRREISLALNKAGHVPVTLQATPRDAVVSVNGLRLRGLDVIWLPTATYKVSAEAEGYRTLSTQTAVAPPGKTVVLTLDRPVVPSPAEAAAAIEPPDQNAARRDHAPGPRWPAWTAFGVGGGALALGAVFHARALTARDAAAGQESGSPAFASALSDFKSRRTVALVSYGVAAVATGFGVWWLLADHRSPGDGDDDDDHPSLDASIGPAGGMVVITIPTDGP
jgi:hypothetical protein